MMRRGFWLVTGAVLGVTGYRKASRVARTITGGPVPARSLPPPDAAATRPALRLGPAAYRQARSAASFARDVRDGMADYRDLHGRQLGRSLGSRRPQQPAGRAASGRSQRGSIEP
jgi:hypothetical protein